MREGRTNSCPPRPTYSDVPRCEHHPRLRAEDPAFVRAAVGAVD